MNRIRNFCIQVFRISKHWSSRHARSAPWFATVECQETFGVGHSDLVRVSVLFASRHELLTLVYTVA